MQYTFICDWRSFEQKLLDDRFLIVTSGETFEEASKKAAEAALKHYPDLAEYETPDTFWEGDHGATQLAALYGDQSRSLVDATTYDVIRAEVKS
ncbi:hypothetical protein ACIBBE_42750 [Streptomyces sp. NPDC051644]|uniref:hypothetical protein n=1 Tax=Streptomyces sp. NPDC051644 TaxID=3365666 RepID=UPI0037981E4F